MKKYILIIISFVLISSCQEINTIPDDNTQLKYNIEIVVKDKNQTGVSNVKQEITGYPNYTNKFILETNNEGSTGKFQVSKGKYAIGIAYYNSVVYRIGKMIEPFELNNNRYEVNLYENTSDLYVQFMIEYPKYKPASGRKVALLYDNNFNINEIFQNMYAKKIYESVTDTNGIIKLINISDIHYQKYGLLIYENDTNFKLYKFGASNGSNDSTMMFYYN